MTIIFSNKHVNKQMNRISTLEKSGIPFHTVHAGGKGFSRPYLKKKTSFLGTPWYPLQLTVECLFLQLNWLVY